MKLLRIPMDLRISLLYAVFGGLWILLSDRLLELLVNDLSTMTQYSIYKGWIYVALSALLIYSLLNRDIKIRIKTEEDLSEREARYRSLFEDSPISLWEEDFSEAKKYLDELKKKGIKNFGEYFESNPEEAIKCASFVRVKDVNRATIKLYGANKKEDLLKSLADLLLGEPVNPFKNELVNIAEGKKRFDWEGINKTLDGRSIYIGLNWSVVPGYEETLSKVIVSINDITERKQGEETLNKKTTELEALFSLSTRLSMAKTESEILPAVLNEMKKVFESDSSAVVMLEADEKNFIITLADGHLSSVTGHRYGIHEGIAAQVLLTHQSVVVDNYANQSKKVSSISALSKIGPAIFAPIQTDGQLIGVLVTGRQAKPDVQPFTPDSARLLTAMGEMVADALRRTRLYDQALRRLNHLQALQNMDNVITSSLDSNLTLSFMLDEVINQLDVDAAAVLVNNPYTFRLEYLMGKGFRTKTIEQSQIHLGDDYAGRAAIKQKPYTITELSQADDFLRKRLITDESFVSYHVMPMISRGKARGVLETFHRSSFTMDEEKERFLKALADQTAIAMDNIALYEDLQKSNFELAIASDATIVGWSNALDLRDKETEGHTKRVTNLTLRLARVLGYSEAELTHVRHGALLHDIGKMGVPDDILLKHKVLTNKEWKIMRMHPVHAYNLLSRVEFLRKALNIPHYHHEKWDGTGYPDGLKGEQIPLEARIFAIVDVWDAITSDRPYRKAWSIKKALQFIRKQSGSHFDPMIVETFLKVIQSNE